MEQTRRMHHIRKKYHSKSSSVIIILVYFCGFILTSSIFSLPNKFALGSVNDGAVKSSARLQAMWQAFDFGPVSVLALPRGSSAQKSTFSIPIRPG